LLALSDEGVSGEEGTLILVTVATTELEVHGGSTDTKVRRATSSSTTAVVIVVVVIVVLVVVLVAATTVVDLSGSGGSNNAGQSGGRTAVDRSGGFVVVVVVVVIVLVVSTSSGTGTGTGTTSGSTTTSGGSGAIRVLDGEVGEAVGNGDLGNAQAGILEGGLERGSRVGVLDVRSSNSRVDQRNNTTELRGGGQAGITADGGDGLGEGVEVLLSPDKGESTLDDSRVIAEGLNNGVGEFKLCMLGLMISFFQVKERRNIPWRKHWLPQARHPGSDRQGCQLVQADQTDRGLG